MNLYWVTTECHDEDWFVIAYDTLDAECFFEDYEGFNPGDSTATFVTKVPPSMQVKTSHPTMQQLVQLGGNILQSEGVRQVEFNGKVYTEGTLQAVIDAALEHQQIASGGRA